MDRNMAKNDFDVKMSGTTAVVAFVRGDQLYTANVGDSRAILATQTATGLQPVELTFDQKPEMAEEQKRIEAAGGIVEPILDPYEGPVGPCRVWVKRQAIPGLAMSRSLGDKLAGTVGVCPDPVVNTFKVSSKGSTRSLTRAGIACCTCAAYK
jgi:serine/threonine protein phosphatase PrpC